MKLFRNIFAVALFVAIMALTADGISAQQRKGQHREAEYEQTQTRNFEEYLHTKCEMVIREMGLSKLDSAHFEPIYHQMQKEKMELYSKYGGMRRVRRAIQDGHQVADTTLLRVLNNNAKLQVEDALLEQTYLNKFSRILTPLQLFKLQQAEQKFRNDMMKQARPAKK